MKYTQSNKQKESYLQDHGVLNTHPERVRDELFLANEFFDPRDLLQVRYEMIRRHQIDKVSVLDTSKQFGVSRVTFYQIAGLYDSLGLIGLVPQKPGPKTRGQVNVSISLERAFRASRYFSLKLPLVSR